jgi:hypothetical protein
MVNNSANPDEELEIVEQTILEILTPNQAQDKENMRRIRKDQEDILEAILDIQESQKQIKAQLALMTDEENPN